MHRPVAPVLLLGLLAAASASCSRQPAGPGAAAPAAAVPSAAQRPAPPAMESSVRVVVLGDSLAAGHGLEEAQAFPAVLEELLQAEGLPARVVNAGVSGDTTAGGLARIDWILRQFPDIVIVELGANDGLRGLSVEATEANLRALAQRSREAGARVLLAGMQVPTSMGPEHAGAFAAVFPRVAADLGLPLVPFLLEGVALVPEMNLPDGVHPTAAGQRRLAENVLPHLRPLVTDALAR